MGTESGRNGERGVRNAWIRHAARPGGRRRGVGDEGAALVEFALVMPILVLLLFGIVEFGINVNDYQSVRQGVRDGARQAVVADYGSGACQPSGFSGSTGSQDAQAIQCTTRKAAAIDDLAVKVVFTDNNGTTDFGTDKVRVCAAVKAKSVTGLMKPFLSGVYLKSKIDMRAEKNLTITNTQDSDPSGANWSWC